MTTKIKQLKAELKKLALGIRQARSLWKDCQRGKISYTEYLAWAKDNGFAYKSGFTGNLIAESLTTLSHRYRHMHIAYCLLRGREYEQIENSVRDNNGPSWIYVERFLKEYSDMEVVNV